MVEVNFLTVLLDKDASRATKSAGIDLEEGKGMDGKGRISMTKRHAVSLIAFSAILGMVGFQNCAKVGVADAKGGSEKMMGDGSVTLTPTDGVGGSLPVDGSGNGTVSSGNSSGGNMDSMPASIPSGSNPDSTSNPGSTTSSTTPSSSSDSEDSKCSNPAECLVDVPTESDAVSLCLNGQVGALKIPSSGLSGPEVVHVRGSASIKSDLLTRVEDIRGHLIIRGQTASAVAKMIKNVRGAMVICGMHVDEISDSRGQILLVNSSVKSISNHRGSIHLMNSEVGSASDLRGQILEIQK